MWGIDRKVSFGTLQKLTVISVLLQLFIEGLLELPIYSLPSRVALENPALVCKAFICTLVSSTRKKTIFYHSIIYDSHIATGYSAINYSFHLPSHILKHSLVLISYTFFHLSFVKPQSRIIFIPRSCIHGNNGEKFLPCSVFG